MQDKWLKQVGWSMPSSKPYFQYYFFVFVLLLCFSRLLLKRAGSICHITLTASTRPSQFWRIYGQILLTPGLFYWWLTGKKNTVPNTTAKPLLLQNSCNTLNKRLSTSDLQTLLLKVREGAVIDCDIHRHHQFAVPVQNVCTKQSPYSYMLLQLY